MSCGCQTEQCSCHGGLHGVFLGALTSDAAVETIFPAAKERGGVGHNQALRDLMKQSAEAGRIIVSSGALAYVPGTGQCSASGKSVASVALSDFAKGEAVAAPFLGPAAPFVELNALIVGLFGKLFNHHAQAVKKEQSVLCAAVPAANNYLQIIDQAVQSGQVTPQNAIAALDSLISDFRSQVSSIIHGSDPTSSGECNAACVILSQLRAIVAYKESQYQDLIAGAAQTVVPSRPNTTSPAGVSVPASSYASFYAERGAAPVPSSSADWLPIAALMLAGFFFLRSA